jgi:hypothetical protein
MCPTHGVSSARSSDLNVVSAPSMRHFCRVRHETASLDDARLTRRFPGESSEVSSVIARWPRVASLLLCRRASPDMARTFCAWVLLLLAASPVTAPFSTCDLRLLVAHTAVGETPAPVRFGSISATESDGVDAYSLAPLVTRCVPPPDSHPSVAMVPARVLRPAGIAGHRGPRDIHRSPHEFSGSPTALRL